MNYLLTAIVFFLIFSVLILIHELGHFIAAKRSGIKVEEFGFGLPPRAWGVKKGETIYSVNWIPFGGFVRMLGEDSRDAKKLKNKRSFAAQPLRTRVKVVVAGVFMNFLLAWLLLTIGFTVGMQPLLGPGDVLPAVQDGLIHLETGVKVREVVPGSEAERAGIVAGDVFSVAEAQAHKEEGIVWYDAGPFPRLKVYDVPAESGEAMSGLMRGDIIVRINGQEIFSLEDFEAVRERAGLLEYTLYREGGEMKVLVEKEPVHQVIVTGVLSEMPAERAGFREGDIVVAVNGVVLYEPQAFVEATLSAGDDAIIYSVLRDGAMRTIQVTPVQGKIGVMLSPLLHYSDLSNLSLYEVELVSSVTSVENVRYSFFNAATESVREGIKLSKFTAVMFIDFIRGFFTSGSVPQSVAGPVGIAQLTHVFVQEGIVPVLRFTALLSLSLAVINILPLPALDGGRLLFLMIEFVIGRPVNPRYESYIHALGYALLLLLILVVTFSDIMRIIGV